MKYSIDQIEDNIVLIENIETKEKKVLKKNSLPKDIQEGSILLYKNNKYIIDKKEEINRLKNIKEKFKKLREK